MHAETGIWPGRRAAMRGAAAVVLASSLSASGCLRSKGGGLTPMQSGDKAEAPGTVKAWPFVPRSIRVHPISQAQIDAKGPRILCHIECRDRTGETTKALGTLRVELLRPSASVEPGMDDVAATWVTDLSDLETNDKLYDPATRTYRLSLRQVPAFLADGLAAGGGKGTRAAILRATLEPPAMAGSLVTPPMSDEYRLMW